MKKTIILLSIAMALLGSSARAQTKKVPVPKRDSLKFDSTEVQTLYRNQQIIQQQLHLLHVDGILRDKLDSVYAVNVRIMEDKFKKPVTNGKKK